jgi:hypothetical protein
MFLYKLCYYISHYVTVIISWCYRVTVIMLWCNRVTVMVFLCDTMPLGMPHVSLTSSVTTYVTT